MEAKEFAEKYANRNVWVKTTSYNDLFSTEPVRVVGYEGNEVLVENTNLGGYGLIDFDKVNFVVPVYNRYTILLYWFRPDKLIPIIDDVPDDCLECGAKGIEFCKDNCPNKE